MGRTSSSSRGGRSGPSNGDLWLREVYPTEQDAVIHRSTTNTLYLMARTCDGQAHMLVCLRRGVPTCRNRNGVLAWLETVLGRNGVGRR